MSYSLPVSKARSNRSIIMTEQNTNEHDNQFHQQDSTCIGLHRHTSKRSWHPLPNPTIRFSGASFLDNQFDSPELGDSHDLRHKAHTLLPGRLVQPPDSQPRSLDARDYSRAVLSASDSVQSDFATIKTVDDLGLGAVSHHTKKRSLGDNTSLISNDDNDDAKQRRNHRIPLRHQSSNQELYPDLAGVGNNFDPYLSSTRASADDLVNHLNLATSKPTPAKDLNQQLRDEYCVSKHKSDTNSEHFVPCNKISTIINPTAVGSILESEFSSHTAAEVEKMVSQICTNLHYTSRRIIFATLLLIGKVEYIIHFFDSNITDDDLPLRRPVQIGDWRQNPFHRRSDNANSPSLTYFQSWEHHELTSFCSSQYEILVPFFDLNPDQVLFYRMDQRIILPFKEHTPKKHGGYGTIHRVKIHPAHHNFRTVSVKRFYSDWPQLTT